MRRYIYLPLLLATACVSARVLAQSPNVPDDERKGFSTLVQDDLRHDIAFLASDHLQGRMSMQPGDDLAVQWIVGQFAKANLDPIAMKASGMPGYEQSFKVIEFRPDRANTAITLLRGGKPTEVWHAPEAFGAYKAPVDITAPVVFAGFGITAPELKYDDYAGLDATGKIVLIFDHEPQEDNPQSVFYGTGNTRYATTRVKVLNAQKHGAVAVIVVAEPNRKHPTNAERAARIGGSITRSNPLPIQAIADDEVSIPSITVNDDVAKALLATSNTLGSDLQTKIEATLTPQSRTLPDTALTLHLRNLSANEGHISNVVGLLRGSDPQLRPETILISAHHDHDGISDCPAGQGGVDQLGQPTAAGADCKAIWHGADDNASGTAGVIALARAFAANGARPKRSILFVVFAGEERGLLGAYWMAAHPLRPLQLTRAQINFDMIGRDETASPQTDGLIKIPADTTNRLNLVGAEYSPDYARTVADADKSIGLTIDDRFDHENALNVLFRSDQFPFLLHNIPAMWWFTGFHPDYHHITDTAEKIDYAKMTKILQLAYLSAWRFGSEDGFPAFVADPGPPPPPPADAPAMAETPAASATPAAPVKPRHHRPVAAVNLGNAQVKDKEEEPTSLVLPPPMTTVSIPSSTTAPAEGEAGSATRAPIAPVATPTAAEDAPAPTYHRPVAPVQIQTSVVPADDDASTEAAMPVAPVATNMGGATEAASDTPAGVAERPAVAPVQLAPNAAGQPDSVKPAVAPVQLAPNAAGQPGSVKTAVTPVKLGGKQPGQDEYDQENGPPN
jgi:hypothetical protein